MPDTIQIHGLHITGFHGVYDEERAEGRRFTVDLDVDVPAHRVASDQLEETVDYRDVARIAVEVIEGPSVHLVETLADEISSRVLDELPPVLAVRIELRKYATGVPGDPEWVGICIERKRTP